MKRAPQENITHLVSNAFAIAKALGYSDHHEWVVYVTHNGTVHVRHVEEELVDISAGEQVPVEF